MSTIYTNFTDATLELCEKNLKQVRDILAGKVGVTEDGTTYTLAQLYSSASATEPSTEWSASTTDITSDEALSHQTGSMCDLLKAVQEAQTKTALGNAQLYNDLGTILEAFKLLGFQPSA